MKTRYTIIVLILLPVLVFAGDDFLFIKQIQEKLSYYLKIRGEEAVYVQTDKPFYANGEDIWLTAFIVDATTNEKTLRSDIVYVELTDPRGNVVSKIKLPVTDGLAKGDFRLKKDGTGGLYKITAYTKWMQNFGNDRFFTKDIFVQKVITPNLLLRPDFEKKAYGPSDEVTLKLKIADLKNALAVNAEITSLVSVCGKLVKTVNTISDENGIALIKFNLPAEIDKADGTVNMLVNYKGVSESVLRTIPIVLNRISLSFYPEGGDLVTGFKSRVAFEALDEYGRGADVSGEIIDESGRSITSFQSFHFGMGAVSFVPEEGKEYYARIIRPVGNNSKFQLPSHRAEYGLNLAEQSLSETNWHIYSAKEEKAAVTVQVHGVMYYNKTVELSKGMNSISIPIKDFPAGIAVFTLFDQNGKEQCERLFFVNTDKRLKISLETDQQYYKPGQEVKLKVKTTDDKGNPVPANLAVSVADDRLLALADDKQDNILSYLFLSSELKGKISEPSFYFNPDEGKAKEAIDYLLLTHGWRRFTWKDVRGNIAFPAILPEIGNTIAGFITDVSGKPRKSQVTLIESSGKKRIMKIQTGDQGQFVFYNVDPTASVSIMTKFPNQVHIWEIPDINLSIPAGDPDSISVTIPMQGTLPDTPEPENKIQRRKVYYESGNVSRSSYVSGGGGLLDEVVVVGYGVMRRDGLFNVDLGLNSDSNLEIENILTGQFANIYIPSRSSDISMPYMATLSNQSLYNTGSNILMAVKGIPLHRITNPNFTLSGAYNVNEKASIIAVNPTEAVFKYGMQAAQGAFELNTRYIDAFPRKSKLVFHRPKYRGVELLDISDFHRAREFYVPPAKILDKTRTDFRTTVFWSGHVKTEENGIKELTFRNNDAATAFRITAEGLGDKGLIGHSESTYSTQLPVSIDTKVPFYINFEDIANIPVTLRNSTTEIQKGKVFIEVANGLRIEDKSDTTVILNPEETGIVYFSLVSDRKNGVFPLKIGFSGLSNDEITKSVAVSDMGFPKIISLSGNSEKSIDFNYDDVIPGTLDVSAVLNMNILEDLMSGFQYIAQRPHGCFEQVSSRNYPNILALKLMEITGSQNHKLKLDLINYLESGYKQLKAYEIEGGGFEWFGSTPAHTVLSAYGLMQFHEMLPVYPDKDNELKKVITRTQEFLMKQRKGDGTFSQSRGKYGFQAGPEKINNAYVTFALAETNSNDILPEYEHALQEVKESKDMYRMALIANAAFSLNILKDYDDLVSIFLKQLKAGSIDKMKVEGSFISGNTGRLEAVAHWVNALIKSKDKYIPEIELCIDYIVARRSANGFGSTQATAMCLKALSEYSLLFKKQNNNAKIVVRLNDGETGFVADSLKKSNPVIAPSFFEENLKPGLNRLSYKLTEGESSYSYSIDIKWKIRTPEKSSCPLVLSTGLLKTEMKVNETVRMEIFMKNTYNTGQPMSMIEVGIPAGLSLQPIQLKELKEKGVYDFYEVTDNRLVLYYRELGPNEEKIINLDLKAEILGNYEGAASSTYLYYIPESRHWIKGESISISK